MGFYNEIAVSEITDKEKALSKIVCEMFNKTNNIFEYTGLPETIPSRFLELYLQTGGVCCVTEVNDKLYAFQGGIGGVPDEYYQPTIFTVANPYLKFNKNLKIGDECILCRNDALMLGIKHIILKYGNLIVENLISFRVAAINTRIQTIIDASDDSAAESVNKYLKDIEAGKLASVTSDELFSKIHVNPASSHDRCITDLIELNQYLVSQMYSEIGIADNYNMKKERLTDEEAKMMTNKPTISIEGMFRERCLFCDAINEKYGTHIKVKINERWEVNEDSQGSFSGLDERTVHSHEYKGAGMESSDDTEES